MFSSAASGETGVSPIARARSDPSPRWWVAPVFAVLVVVLLLSGAGAGIGAAAPAGPGSVVEPHSPGPTGEASSVASTQLAEAQRSLEAGQGPAVGRSVACANAGSSLRCGSEPAAEYSGGPAPAWSPVGGPDGRLYNSLTYDAADGYVVLFGGEGYSAGSSNYVGDTWTFHDGVWTQLHPHVSPPARESAYMTFDALDGYVLLFGGYSGVGSGEFGDTWEFLGGQWTELIPASACTGVSGPTPCPAGRDSGAMTYDAADKYVLLFGEYAWYGDTWAYSFGRWTQLINASSCTGTSGTVPCPAPRSYESMAYDPAIGKVVMFGGDSSFAGPTNDTWEFSNGSWSQVIASGACTGPLGSTPCPSGREGAAMTYDPALGEVVLFGGWNGTSGSTATFGDDQDTWAFNGATWHEIGSLASCAPTTCPPPRSDAALAFDAADNEAVLFGGYYRYQDTWTFNGTNWSLNVGPSDLARTNASMAYDAADGYVVLFGGNAPNGGYLGDTWSFVNGQWTERIAASACTEDGGPLACPSPRAYATLTDDAADGYLVLFGGVNASGALNDTWAFSDGTWTELISPAQCAVVSCPTARWAAAAAYDPLTRSVVLTAGDGAALYNDTWEFSAGAWTVNISTSACLARLATCPTLAAGASAAWDANDSEVVLFGGVNLGGTLDDTYTYADNGTWVERTNASDCAAPGASCPSARWGASLAYDAADRATVLFGGANGSTLGDTWTWANNTWTYQDQSYSSSAPNARAYASMAYDGADGYLLLVGGYGGTALGDSWSYGVPIVANTPVAIPGTLDLGQSLELSATATGGGYGSYGFEWNGLPSGCLAPALASTVECTPTEAGSSWVSDTVSDSDGVAGTTSYYTTVQVDADPVVTLSASSASVAVGQSVTLTATASGGSGSFVDYTWGDLPTGCAPASASQPTVTCPVGASAVGSWAVTVSVNDTNGFTVTSAPVALSVQPAPWAVSLSASLVALDVGENTTLTANVSGTSAPLVYVWSGLWSGCAPSGANVTCAPAAAGSYWVSVTALGPDGIAHTSNTVPLLVSAALSGAAVVESAPSVAAGSSVSFGASATGGTGPWSYDWHGLPSGCFGGDEAVVTCAPTATGTFSVSVTISDATGASSTSAAQSLTVSAAASTAKSTSSNSTGFASGANGLEWTILGLVVVTLLVAAVAAVLAARRGPGGGSPPPKEWSESGSGPGGSSP